jgi:hypothetical protein
MNAIDIAYLAFGLCALLTFWRCRPDVAALSVFLGGWILLPVGHYPAGSAVVEFPYWIIGLALPSDMLQTKAWIAPAAALIGAAIFDGQALRRLRPVWLDLPMLLWCLWPLLQSAVSDESRPAGWIGSLYLLGCWGLPWLLGRLYFSTRDGQWLLARGLVWSALACLPFSLIEGVFGPMLYDLVYETHPFRADGAVRYLGFRPLGFFENGNQFGLWVSLCALAALWLGRSTQLRAAAVPARVRGGVVATMAIVAQSLGGILLLGLGAGFLSVARFVRPKHLVAGVLALVIGLSAVYVSGVVPITRIGKNTALGQQVVNSFRAIGRGSFAWRISQDQKLLQDAMARPVLGTAAWDWWRPKGLRPWGLAMLVLGQFGLAGLCLCLGTLVLPVLRVAWQAPRASGWLPEGLPLMLATLVALMLVDAMLNSFIFFPAVMIAGGLAATSPQRRQRGEITRIPACRAG